MSEEKQIPIDDVIKQTISMRAKLVDTQVNANTASVTGFDNVVNYLDLAFKKINLQKAENEKLKTELQVAQVEIKKLKDVKK